MAKLTNPENNFITQSLQDRLEDMETNLAPQPATFQTFFSNYHNKKNLKYAYQMMGIGMAAQRQAQANYEEAYRQIERRIEDLAEQRPYLRKAILGRQSEVKKGAEMALKRSFDNQSAYANSMAQRNMGAAVLSSLAKSKEQQKQQTAASTAFEMAKEKVARRQLYNQVVNRNNRLMQSSLANLQQMASAHGGIGLSGLQTGLGGMIGAGAGVAGLGQAQGAWSLSQQEHRLNMQLGLGQTLTNVQGGQLNMQANLQAARRVDRAQKEVERDTQIGSLIGAGGATLGWLGANTGIGKRFTDWAQGGVSKAMGRLFGDVNEKGTA